MSVQCTEYVGLGYKLDYAQALECLEARQVSVDEFFDAYHDSAYNTAIVEVDGISIVVDSMCGDYLFVGKIFGKGTESEPLDFFKFPKAPDELKALIAEKTRALFSEIEIKKPRFFYFKKYR